MPRRRVCKSMLTTLPPQYLALLPNIFLQTPTETNGLPGSLSSIFPYKFAEDPSIHDNRRIYHAMDWFQWDRHWRRGGPSSHVIFTAWSKVYLGDSCDDNYTELFESEPSHSMQYLKAYLWWDQGEYELGGNGSSGWGSWAIHIQVVLIRQRIFGNIWE